MSALSADLAEYLALRRSLGYKLERSGEVLDDFVAALDEAGAEHITVALALAWAMRAPSWRAQRLGMVRCFARYLHAIDPRHEVPPPGLVQRGSGRPAPFVFAEDDVVALMAAARQLRAPLRAVTFETLIGLLAVSGLRVGEVIRLDRSDVDLGAQVLVVRNSKLGRSRHVPLHPTATEALRSYLHRRDHHLPRPASSALFVSTTGTRLRSGNVRTTFAGLLERAGLPTRRSRQGPRLGDFRHSFAVRTLTEAHLAGADVEADLAVLSTYLGHVSPSSTYWYLSASPTLLEAAARRLDHPRRVAP